MAAALAFCVAATAAADQSSTERPSVTLGEGRVGPFRWAAEILPGGKNSEPGSICLNEATLEYREIAELEVCGPVDTGLVQAERDGTRKQPMEVVTFLLRGSFSRLYLKLAGQPGHTYRMKQFSAEELGPISEVPLSSFTRAYGHRVCLQRYVAYNEAGNVAFAGRRDCPGGHGGWTTGSAAPEAGA